MTKPISNSGKDSLMNVEVKEIASLAHNCDGCINKDFRQSCCATYEVCITADEMEAIVGVLPEVVKYCPELRDEDNFHNVFEETEDGLISLDTTEEGLCVFAYEDSGELRCSLHSIAVELKVPVQQIKPSVCLLWPLSVADDKPRRLSIADDALEFHCNTQQDPGELPLDVVVFNSIGLVYGEPVSEAVKNAVEVGCDHRVVSMDRPNMKIKAKA